MSETTEIRTQLRIPTNLHARINEAAKLSGRSMNAEIVQRLEASFPPDIESEMLQQRMEELASLQRSLEQVRMVLHVEEKRLRETDPEGREYDLIGRRISVFQHRMETLSYLVSSVQADVTRLLHAKASANSDERPGPRSI